MKLYHLTVIACCCLLTGCPGTLEWLGRQFPTMGPVEVTGAVHRSQSTVLATINHPEDSASNVVVTEVLLSYRSTLDSNQGFVPSGTMAEVSSDDAATQYEGSLPALSYGPYEARVQARLKYEPQSPEQPSLDEQDGLLIERTEPFFVSDSDKVCFTFANDLEGWTFDGIFDGDDVNNPYEPTCLQLGFWDSNAGGVAALSLNCAPNSEPASGFWTQDYVSPELEELSEWQGLQSFVFTISAHLTIGPPAVEVRVQPILTYEDADEQTHSIVPVSPSGQPIFYTVGGPTTIEWSPQLATDTKTVRLKIRVFLEHGITVGETVCRLHTVCPSGDWLTDPVVP